MRYSFIAAALLARFAAADLSQAVDDLQSYIESLETNSAFLAVVESIATDPAAISSLQAYETSVFGDLQNGVAPTGTPWAGLPKDAQSLFSSIYNVEVSILSKDGVTFSGASGSPVTSAGASAATTGSHATTGSGTTPTAGSPTSSSSSHAMPTAVIGISIGLIGGLMGVVAAL